MNDADDRSPATVTRERTVDATVAEVWETLTDDALLSLWLADEVELEPVEGGEGRFEFSGGDRRDVRVEEVEPEERISWSWWSEGSGTGRVELTVDAVAPGRTRVIVIESRTAPAAGTGAGWSTALSALASMHGRVCA